jgi:hypothetical protein
MPGTIDTCSRRAGFRRLVVERLGDFIELKGRAEGDFTVAGIVTLCTADP